jgi:hypothetical protein
MYPAKDARELGILLRISRDLDVVGDVTATVDNPSELLAWALVLADPTSSRGVPRTPDTATYRLPPTGTALPSVAASLRCSHANTTRDSGTP